MIILGNSESYIVPGIRPDNKSTPVITAPKRTEKTCGQIYIEPEISLCYIDVLIDIRIGCARTRIF